MSEDSCWGGDASGSRGLYLAVGPGGTAAATEKAPAKVLSVPFPFLFFFHFILLFSRFIKFWINVFESFFLRVNVFES
jgi:hypothetical protein